MRCWPPVVLIKSANTPDSAGSDRTAAIVLAAGASTRLGRPKQLVRLNNEALLCRTVRIALEAGCSPVIVVLGACAQPCREALATLPSGLAKHLRVVENPRWAEGMSTTLRAGLAALGVAEASARTELGPPHPALASSETPGKKAGPLIASDGSRAGAPSISLAGLPASALVPSALVLVTDQVRLTPASLERLLRAHHAGASPVTAALYGGRLGVPAIFRAALLPELAALSGDQGARKLLAAWADRAIQVPMPEAAFEVDTPEDLAAFDLR